MEFRSESKYFITKTDTIIFEHQLKNIMTYDSHSNEKKYNIRTIYFDSPNNKCFYENENGFDKRFKLRIRMYNRSKDDIKLEYKYKENGNTKKMFCDIKKNLCIKLLNGYKLEYGECDNQVLRKLYLEQKMNNFMPKILVEYERLAFTEKTGNVRVTFDTNIRASRNINRFFKENIYARPIIDNNLDILEVKYDELIPDYIKNVLNNGKLQKVSFSKYYLSRLEFEEELL